MNGMLSQDSQAPQTQSPYQGMLSGNMSSGKFNGDINVGGKTLHVTDGLVDGSNDQHQIYVAADGSVVFNEKRQILGSLDSNNVLQKPTQELIAKFQSMGALQGA